MEESIKILIPTSWDDVTVEQYSELIQFNLTRTTIQKIILYINTGKIDEIITEDELEDLFLTLSILLNLDIDVINKFSVTDLELILRKLVWLSPLKTNKKSDIDLKKIQVGTWIDIERIMTSGLEDNIPKFLAKLAGKDVSNEPITNYYNLISDFIIHRKQTYETFKGLFESDDVEEEGYIKSSEELKYEAFNKKWNWYNYLYQLAGEDVLKMEAASELNFIHSLNHFSFLKERSYLKK